MGCSNALLSNRQQISCFSQNEQYWFMLPYLKITHTTVHTCIHTAYMQSPDKVVQAAWTIAGTAPSEDCIGLLLSNPLPLPSHLSRVNLILIEL